MPGFERRKPLELLKEVGTHLISCAIMARNSDFLSLASRSFLAMMASDLSRALYKITDCPVTNMGGKMAWASIRSGPFVSE